jgi:hypothetical protein
MLMQIVIAAEVQPDRKNVGSTLRTGATIRQSLLAADTPDGLNFTVNRTEWLSGADANTTPRHHHAFQQIRWAESGSINFAPGQDIAEGDLAYFPRGTWYGPQERDQGISLTIQFGFDGEKQHGSAFWNRYQAGAMEKLRARGTFEDGLFIEIDPATGERRETDSVEALYEEQFAMHTNRKFVIPAAGYEKPILIHPAIAPYYQAEPGVEVKQLGRFFDHPGPHADVRFSMVRLTDRAAFRLGKDRAQIAWTRSAGLWLDGREYPEATYLYSAREEEAEIRGERGVELILVEFPRLD